MVNKDVEDITKITKDINETTDKIKQSKKNKRIMNFKIARTNVRRFAPYLISGAISLTVMSKLGISPFVLESLEKTGLTGMKSVDSNEKVYEIFLDEDDIEYDRNDKVEGYFKEYSKWVQNEDGTFGRTVNIYEVNKASESKLELLLNDFNLVVSDILGDPIASIPDYQSILTEDEIFNNSEVRERIIYLYETISENQGLGSNALELLLFLVFVVLESIIIMVGKEELNKAHSSYEDRVLKIKDKYSYLNRESLEYALEQLQKRLAVYFADDNTYNEYKNKLLKDSKYLNEQDIDDFIKTIKPHVEKGKVLLRKEEVNNVLGVRK